ncbi:Ubiquitin carboxyl-terminal hydrolase 7 [Cichlidogyrus casuarinus]|uniref:Ubiquitin carboxyl-terminal hydrolase 7 n=1 Tax=Cichlidogyrus casuarinus TaxID=1844966 RepID=A0ABD2QFQ5_9PLAT
MFNKNKDIIAIGSPEPEDSVEAMDVEVVATTLNETENKNNSQFGYDLDSEEFEQYSESDESRPCGTIEYRFDNVSRFKTRVADSSRNLSEPVKIRCLPWKILLLFNKDDLGIFVQCNGDNESNTWNCSAKARIDLVRQNHDDGNKTNTISHVFTSKENDWGYRSFLKLEELFNPQNGYVHNDCIIVRAHIEAEAPHGADWDSKKHTGFVGLKNQGATCYLNSLLQTLYFTNKLRKAVFLMPTESDDSQTSVPLALQRVLYELMFSETAVGTKKLTRSFGWATLDSFMQHDAQELCRVLLDNLENKMKGTSVEDVIPGLFCGKMLSYIRCKHVDYESKREENFYDIQLKVKGNGNVYEAFNEYVAVETLDNENKYDAGSHGLQAAEKGVKFIKFPPVLYLQLMRFQYDYQTDMNVKINDKFEFPYMLDLEDFLYQKDPCTDAKYFLHAVLVHSGDNHGGHYVVFLNPRGDHNWYEFDDDVVSRCERKAAIKQNYGSNDNMRSSSNAYMLVYIANSAKDEVLCPVEEQDIPDYLLERFREETRIEKLKSEEKKNAHRYTMVHLLLEEDFHGYEGPGLFISQRVNPRSIRVCKEANHEKFQAEVAEALNRPPNSIKLWKVMRKKEDSYRLVALDSAQSQLFRLHDEQLQATFFVQFMQPSQLVDTIPDNRMLLFFKYFDQAAFELRYLGLLYESGQANFEQLRPQINLMIGLEEADNSPILLLRHETNDQISQIRSLEGAICKAVTNGEVIILALLQPPHTAESLSDLIGEETGHDALQVLNPCDGLNTNGASAAAFKQLQENWGHCDVFRLRRCLLAAQMEERLRQEAPDKVEAARMTIKHYIEEFPQYVEVLLVDRNRAMDPGILITVKQQIDYWDFARSVARLLGVDAHHLQFFRSTSGSGQFVQAASPQIHDEAAGNDSTGTPSPGSAMTSLISAQMLAARASGFHSSNAQNTTLLASAASQGLAREPPGPAIGSSSTSMQKHLIPIDTTSSMTKIHNMAHPQYQQSHQIVNYGNNSTTQALLNGEKMPFPISRFNGMCTSQSNSLGSHNILPPRRVYYSHLSISIEEQETMRQIKCIFIGPKLTDSLDLTLCVPQNGTVNDLLNEARFTVPSSMSLQAQDAGIAAPCLGELRLLEVQSCKTVRVLPGEMSLKNVQMAPGTMSSHRYYPVTGMNSVSSVYRIEEVPADEQDLEQDQRVIWVAHVEPESQKCFGTPFSIPIKLGESFSAIKERMRKRLDVTEKEFEKWKLIYSNQHQFSYLPPNQDISVVLTLFQTNDNTQPLLLIEHKPAKRPRYAPSQKPIKIHN